MFKSYMKTVANELNKPSRGLGDTFSKITTLLTIKQSIEYFSKKIKKDCGCARRTKTLNTLFPYAQIINRYILFVILKEQNAVVFKVLNCKEHEEELAPHLFSERPLYLLRWKDEQFAMAEYHETHFVSIPENTLLLLLKSLLLFQNSTFFNALLNGDYNMTTEQVHHLEKNMEIFLRNRA